MVRRVHIRCAVVYGRAESQFLGGRPRRRRSRSGISGSTALAEVRSNSGCWWRAFANMVMTQPRLNDRRSYGPNLARSSGATTGHDEFGAGKSPCRTRAMNRYPMSRSPAGTMRPTIAITRQPPPRRSRMCNTAEDRVKICPSVVSTRMLGGKASLCSAATNNRNVSPFLGAKRKARPS